MGPKFLVADFNTSKFDDDELIAWEALLVNSIAICNATCASTDTIESVQDFVTHITTHIDPTLLLDPTPPLVDDTRLSPQVMKCIQVIMPPDGMLADQEMLHPPPTLKSVPAVCKMVCTFRDCVA